MIDRHPGQGGVAAPLALAGHHEVEVESLEETHALAAHVRVDADEGFVEEDQARRMLVGGAIVGRGGGELRDREGRGLLAARARAVGVPRQALPLAVLAPFDAEPVPGSVVERLGQLVAPGALSYGPLGADLLQVPF